MNSNSKTSNNIINKIKLSIFCILLGTVAGCVLWLFLRLVSLGTALFWEILPQNFSGFKWYPVILCTVGGLIIGIFRKKFGDYPEPMMQVIGTVKKTGTYEYNKIGILIIAALMPLVFGSSVGPEAGMVGIITALACWIGDNSKYASANAKLSTDISTAVSLSALFYSPLFGFFAAVEDDEQADQKLQSVDRKSKLLIYGLAIGSSLGINMLLNEIFGKVSQGFPAFPAAQPNRWDILMMIVYIICGIVLGIFFHKSEGLFEKASKRLPPVAGEVTAGLILGVVAIFMPVLLFSGEHEIARLIEDYTLFAPGILIGIAFGKVILTSICIQLGLKGGHFFPLIFAAVCLGYGISLLVFPQDMSHAIFAAGVTTAATLSVSIKKPLAVTCLLFVCFPIKMGIPIFISSIIASQASSFAINKG